MSSGETAPSSTIVFSIQRSSPSQYFRPISTTGNRRIFPVWMRVSDSKNSSIVPNPPGMMTYPEAYFTNITLRAKKCRKVSDLFWYRFRFCSSGSWMFSPIDIPFPWRAPRFAASMIPGPPPEMMANPRLASSSETFKAVL